MAFLRRTFHHSRMNLDADNRTLPNGEYREATNIVVINNEGSNEGSIRKALSNKRLTNLNFGANVRTLGQFTYEARNRIYWLVLSDSGSYLCEWDHDAQAASFVLMDTRAPGSRVFDLKEDHLVTAINIIPSDDPDKELMLLTDNNMQPLCFNISRAKNYGENGFEEDDILLIKKPPRLAPTAQLTYTGGTNNDIKEEFFAFCYRYRYLDGEYSALSDITEYQFAPGRFELDYITLEMLGMQNNFNAIRLGFKTGDKRVTDVQLIFKKSNSNVPYLIENFNKEDEAWGDNQDRDFIFTNNKNYIALPERELMRHFDNVPLKAGAQTVIGNKVFFANYTENFNLIDKDGRKVKPDFSLELVSNDLGGTEISFSINGSNNDGGNTLTFDLTGITLAKDTLLRMTFDMQAAVEVGPATFLFGSYNQTFDFILPADYANAEELATSVEFTNFVDTVMQQNFIANYSLTPPDDSTLETVVPFSIDGYTATTIAIKGPIFTFKIDNTPDNPEDNDFTFIDYNWHFFHTSDILFRDFAVATSLHSNRSYEVGILYKDPWKRSTTPLGCANNTIFIPQELSIFQNKIRVTVNNFAPAFADIYKFVVKQNTLSYYTIYAVLFYEDGPYRWVRLDGANKDKVKKDDILVLKADLAGPRLQLFKVAVIDVVQQEENFISGNANPDSEEITEEAGLYMKIKADGMSINADEAQFFYYNKSHTSQPDVEMGHILQTFDEGSGQYVDLPVNAGTRIRLRYFCDPAGTSNSTPLVEWEQEFVAQDSYDNFEEWFDAEFIFPPEYDDAFSITFERDPDNNSLIIIFRTLYTVPGNDIRATVAIQRTSSVLIFETEPTNDIPEIYYEASESFDIVNGYHKANVQGQDDSHPAIVELDFFNCYAFGNGAESYRVKDLVNKPWLNIDLKPTAATIEPYKQVVRPADITYSEAYIESQNINGLNVFNLSTGNFKDDMEKQYGPIRKLWSREGDIVVFQEEKTGQVLYDKDAIYTADANANLVSVPGVLGRYIPYMGEFGIGKHPESFSTDEHGRIKYASVKKGAIVRLSMDGIEKIVYGMKNFFRDLFRGQPNAKIISGYDPYLDLTTFSIGNEPVRLVRYNCGNSFIKSAQAEPFSYEFRLNNLGGDIVIAYTITEGSATITASFDGEDHVASNVTGSGTLTFERSSLVDNIVTVTVTPIGGAVSYMITNTCPIGSALTIVSLVLSDSDDTGLTMTDRYKWNGSPFASTSEFFTTGPVTRFQSVTGVEGVGTFPANGALMTIQAFKDTINSGHFALSECNRLGYLITDTVYNSTQYQDILDHPDTVFLTVTSTGEAGFTETNSAQFLFNRTEADQRLYLIWDYTSRNPIVSDDSANVTQGGTVIIDVLDNDEVEAGAVVTIATQPQHGSASVNGDMEVVYEHDGSENFNDSFTYTVTEGGCSSTATITISIGVTCGGSLTASGGTGIYNAQINFGTDTGWCGIQFNALNVPDRFQLIWDGVVVADSKYVGDNLNPGPPVSYTPTLLNTFNLSVFEYNGSGFTDTGIDEEITIVQDDISNNTTEATDGNGFLVFNKTTPTPTTVILRAVGPVGGTAWDLNDVICPTNDVIEGIAFFAYGFFTEANKAHVTKSKMLWRGSAPDKFYTNRFGDTNFSMYGDFATAKFINDGTNWYELDTNGNIVTQGAL